MTDYQTTTHSSPSEEDMNKIVEVFGKMRDSVIEASRLAETVRALQSTVEAMQQDIASYRNQISALDESLAHVRRQRDDAEQRADQAERDLGRERDAHVQVVAERDSLRHSLNDVRNSYADLRSNFDDVVEQLRKTREEDDALRSKLSAIEAVFSPKPASGGFGEAQPRTEQGQFAPVEPNVGSGFGG